MSRPPRTALHSVLLYAHDTFGLGHLRRSLAIAGYLGERWPGLQTVLLTGSPVAERFAVGRGITLVRLPPVVKVGPNDYRPRDPAWSPGLVRRTRTAIMMDVASRLRPDVFLVDHAPQGMRGELLPVFAALRSRSPATRIVLGLRDVVDDPQVVRRTWSDQGVYDTLANVFDRILVYGSCEMLDVVEAYAIAPATAAKLSYCGYLGRQRLHAVSGPAEAFVLGTAGGGGDGAEMLLAMLRATRQLGLPALAVTGPLMDRVGREQLQAEAATSASARVVEFAGEMIATMARARVVVTMGGYNTLCELAAIGASAVVVPRLHPRREQVIRAHLFEARGLVQVVEPGPDLVERLTAALASALVEHRPLGSPRIDLHGLARTADALECEAGLSRTARWALAPVRPIRVPA